MTRYPACILALVTCAALAAAGCSSVDAQPIAKKHRPATPATTTTPDPSAESDGDGPGAAAGPDGAPAAPNAFAEAIDALFTDATAKDAFSGSVVVVDAGKKVLEKGFGAADRKANRDNRPDTIFRIGSVSKQFAASAVLALVQDGKLSLTDPVSKFFPSYPKQNLAQGGTEVTLHHLLSHTSGLPDPGATTAFQDAVWRRPIAPTEQIELVKSLPLVAQPGAVFAYLNFNFLLAALVVEKVSGQSYESFLRARFFDPLGMKDTGTALPADTATTRAAVGYAENGGMLAAFADDPRFGDRDVSFAFGSGQIYSTVQDLARWDRALTGDAVLGAPERALLFKPNLEQYGYGWGIETKAGVVVERHNGALSPLGFTALIVRVPSKDRFVAYLANMDSDRITPFEARVEELAVK